MFDKITRSLVGCDPSFEDVKALELEPGKKAEIPGPEEPEDCDDPTGRKACFRQPIRRPDEVLEALIADLARIGAARDVGEAAERLNSNR